ncbi:MAG: tRNA lysidine(34) synthetase TilS [Candidatus Peregrinibacteria bacterium]
MIFQIQDNLRQIPPFKRVVIGVSGGADSVALTLLLHHLKYEIIIAHLNHNLRGQESEKDAEFVQKFAKKLKVICVTQKVVIPKKGNLEANARRIRYKFLESVRKKHQADYIAVAHHRGDQIETILMNLLRGAHLRGLAGMQVQTEKIIRPLLTVTKKEILSFLKREKQDYRTDTSNHDTKYLRNRLRHFIIPNFKKKNRRFETELLEMSCHARKELESLVQKARNWLKCNVKKGRFNRENFQLLPSALKGEVIIQLLKTSDLYSKNIHKLIAFMEGAKTSKVMTVKGKTFTVEYREIRMGKKEIKAPKKKQITATGIIWGNWKLKKLQMRRGVKGYGPLFARPWAQGDRFQPLGMKGTKKVQDYFTDAKIPKEQRRHIPIIVDRKDKIISIGNLRWSQLGKKWKDGLSVQQEKV